MKSWLLAGRLDDVDVSTYKHLVADQLHSADQYGFLFPIAGTLRKLHILRLDAPGAAVGFEHILRKNGVDTAFKVSISGAAVSGSELVSELAVAPGDYVGLHLTKIGAPVPTEFFASAIEFEPADKSRSCVLSGYTVNSDEFMAPHGISNAANFETRAVVVMPCAGRITKLAAKARMTGAGKYRQFSVRVNLADPAGSVPVRFENAMADGAYAAQTQNIAVAAGDLVCVRMQHDTGYGGLNAIALVFEPDRNEFPLFATSNYQTSPAATRYFPLSAGFRSPGATDDFFDLGIPDFRITAVYARLALAPGGVQTCTITPMKSGVAAGIGPIVLSGANTTGNAKGIFAMNLFDKLSSKITLSAGAVSSHFTISYLASFPEEGSPYALRGKSYAF